MSENQKTEDLQKAKSYSRIQNILSISGTLLSILLLVIFIFGGYSTMLRNWTAAQVGQPYLQLLLFVGVLSLLFSIVSFPLSFISGFWLEHRYGLSNQSFGAWLWEKSKGMLVGVFLTLPLLLALFFFLRNYPQTWWLWTATILFIFSVVIGKIAPQVIFPLFYKFEKLDDENLLQRMQKLARKGNFNLEGVYRFDMSKTTKKANAAFTGIGKSKRIIIGDTLLDNFSEEEIETVFAHEVGHYVHKHILQGIVISTISSYALFGLSHLLYVQMIPSLNYSGVADLAALPLLSLIISLLSLLLSPLSNALSRRNERQADRYALENSEQPSAFIDALQKLSKSNLSDPDPHPVIEFLFHSHPAINKRVAFARDHLRAQ